MARLLSATLVGIDALPVEVEVDITRGLPGYYIVGLPDESVRESRERVRSAVLNSGSDFPARRITINLAPGDRRKAGALFDLPIALGILATQGVVTRESLDGYLVAGELSLTGEVRPIRGALSMAATAAGLGLKGLILPRTQWREAMVVEGPRIVPVGTLTEALAFLRGEFDPVPPAAAGDERAPRVGVPDFADVRGQAHVRRGLEVAAAGGHNVLLVGPPGAGKTMMASRVPGILPPLLFEEAIETTRIHSVAGLLADGAGLVACPPFRAPHHTVSHVGLVGGGSHPRPGEISLATNGVLFLDELPEFSRRALESLRQPMEAGTVVITRAAGTVTYPARFMLIAAMNPCPCGRLGDPARPCRCGPGQIERYRARISGPLLDRIDLRVDVPPVKGTELLAEGPGGEESAAVRRRVERARERQRRRGESGGTTWNSRLSEAGMRETCRCAPDGQRLLARAMTRLALSARAHGRVLRVARTIADLEGASLLEERHVAEAVQYRSPEGDMA